MSKGISVSPIASWTAVWSRFVKKKKTLSCFSCFCVCACFVGHNMHTRDGKKGVKSRNMKDYIFGITAITLAFYITFGSSFRETQSLFRCFPLFCLFCMSCWPQNNDKKSKSQNKHNIAYFFTQKRCKRQE